MRLKIVALAFVVALLVAVAVPLFSIGTAEAIVHPNAPICQGLSASEGAAGGKAAAPVLKALENVPGPPMPAQGAENSEGHSPGAKVPGPGGGCP